MSGAQDALRRLRVIAGEPLHQTAKDGIFLGEHTLGLPLLERRTMHEFFAAERPDAPAAAGFVACIAAICGKEAFGVLWVRHTRCAGGIYGHGLATLGIDPGTVIHLPLADEKDVLRAGLEGLRSNGLTCVIIEIAGHARTLDLSATRRLRLAAAEHGVTALILRSGARPSPSAAQTRWLVTSALSDSPGLGLPGRPTFTVTLLKHRSAEAGRTWDLEWDHETRKFVSKALSRLVAAPSFDRPYPASGTGRRAEAG